MNKNTLIAIGGKSGSGKTTLASALIKCFPTVYERPKSCTTRSKRSGENDEEYNFISHDEFVRFSECDEFLNIDYVYGNYYAIKTQSITDVIASGKIPIKEIHPQNHAKIRELFNGTVLSVLVKSSLAPSTNTDRAQQDNTYYDSINEDEFDIVFFYDIDLSPERNAYYFHQKIRTTLIYEGIFPPSGIIDALNREGYEKVANDFTEEKRITTRNFHELSAPFFRDSFAAYVTENAAVAEIGPGQGWLYRTVAPKCRSYVGFDISSAMVNTDQIINKIISSVRCTNSRAEMYDAVVASLSDPYFYPEAICEIARILKESGYFIFSIPSNAWASAFRKDKNSRNKTSFLLDSGEMAQVFSFASPESDVDLLLRNCGFEKILFKQETGARLIGHEISPAIITAASSLDKDITELGIITTAIYRKKGVYNYE